MSNFNLNPDGTFPRLGNYIINDEMCGPDKVAVDLGANAGLFELAAHDKFKNIYYFEASHNNFIEATRSILDPDNKIDNCFGFNLAVAGETGKLIKIYGAKTGDRGSNTILSDVEHSNNDDYHHVLSISINDIFNLIGVNKIHYLKMDIEGAEHEALMSADLKNVEYICIEIHNMLGIDKIVELKNKLLETHNLSKTIVEGVDWRYNEESLWERKK
tara:strand:- start:84 stop:731 length:648 start_codon:yes stop_codon:yes gene_type:complete